ncbi:PEP-CTERM sorting domain-containing protein [Alteromonas pelagimontana]|uniref:PEP-CTERM sorting domain-containing protein n=1 Tax=Alteromonas pelagimontana TaxID=1858656 RepID=A0A6M4M8J8_9ALTE|nr:PEP-CTERM sorting domain-containing protein [Alteromonas pelagimontana]QJR79483.1 PEP-CTERM sorting domain-containing protein [Alteromonas pelagimontana]
MKSLKRLCSAAVLMSCSLLFATSSNAAIINQSIIVEGSVKVGQITMNLDDSLLNTGLVSSYDTDDFSLVGLSILGNSLLEFFDFEAIIDTANVAAGLEFLYFDVLETIYDDNWSYQLTYDKYNPESNFLDVFDSFNLPMIVSNDIQLVVPEPSVFALFVVAMGFMVSRRRSA